MISDKLVEIFHLLESTECALNDIVIWELDPDKCSSVDLLLLNALKLLLSLVPEVRLLLVLSHEEESLFLGNGFLELVLSQLQLLESLYLLPV